MKFELGRRFNFVKPFNRKKSFLMYKLSVANVYLDKFRNRINRRDFLFYFFKCLLQNSGNYLWFFLSKKFSIFCRRRTWRSSPENFVESQTDTIFSAVF